MNNSLIALDNVSLELETPLDNSEKFRTRDAELTKIIAALTTVAASREWHLLEELIFQGVVTSLKRERETEIEKQPLNGPKIHNLNGQIKWANKYLDLSSLALIYKQELVNIRKQLNAKG